ncbi:uncharacterized protein K452DRAFT_153517 [Aplosporella prunicola CBS 121167]|uniref:USP domain-containing protein n=1 Tax=Aplosporella prunicola CBS 121167 TaxID=1176127 RepID=A0A6A6BJ10_9PEZI|nr:uncharacterized protein K452DRAFT_153517 [Aplosporella prunicola CBS 121167]KAF2144132.1 hypothetical protein K452DRAFT_153517 [Aplosporella prunicola CBS 121167]
MDNQHVMDPHPHILPQTSPADPSAEERRDSMEDADASPGRFKRPRLDSGSRELQNMAADLDEIHAESLAHDPVTSADAPATPSDQKEQTDDDVTRAPQTPSRVTINVRTPQSPSHITASNGAADAPAAHEPEPEPELHAAAHNTNMSPPQRSSPSAPSPKTTSKTFAADASRIDAAPSPVDSPPIVEIDVDDSGDAEDSDNIIDIDDDENEVRESIFDEFPFAKTHSLDVAAGGLLSLISKPKNWHQLTEGILSSIARWMNKLSSLVDQNKLDLYTAYINEPAFWDKINDIFRALLMRGRSYEDAVDLGPDQQEEDALVDLFQAYARVAAQIFAADVEYFERNPQPSTKVQHVMAPCHILVLSELLVRNPEVPFWILIRGVLAANPIEVCASIMSGFFASRHGLSSLVGLIRLGASMPNHELRSTAAECLQLVQLTTEFALAWSRKASTSERRFFVQQLLKLFRELDPTTLATSKAPSELCTNLVRVAADLLQCITEMDRELAAQLATEILGDAKDLYPTDCYPEFVRATWQLRALKFYMTKGHMAQRICGVEGMSQQLIEMWSRWSKHGNIGINALAVFGQTLLDEGIIDYLIGVDSHAQLVSRCGNVVGFLTVSNRWSDKQSDSIWASITQSQDPRMVEALTELLIHCIALMDITDLLYLCTKLRTLPVDKFHLGIQEVFHRICSALHNKAHIQAVEWRQVENRMHIFELCVHLIQESFLMDPSTPVVETLHQRACKELSNLSKPEVACDGDRQKIYEACIQEIEKMTAKAAPSAKVIYIIARASIGNEAAYLATDFGLTESVAKELCSFIDTERTKDAGNNSNGALGWRLELLFYLVSQCPESIPPGTQEVVWDHLVGCKSIDDDARNIAWHSLSQMVRVQATHNAFLDRCATDLLPKVNPQFYTAGLYEFLYHLIQWQLRTVQSTGITLEGILEPPSVELLWQVLLTARPGTIEGATAEFLALLYLDGRAYNQHHATYPNLAEDTHKALVNRCIRQLVEAHAALSVPVEQTMQDEQMQGVSSDDGNALYTLRFQRTFLFLAVLLNTVKKKPEFRVASPRLDKPTTPAVVQETEGEPTTIRFQAYWGQSSDMQTVTVGDLVTVSWLKNRLREWTGFTRFKTVYWGKMIKLDDMANQTLREAEFTRGHFLIIKERDKDSVSYDRATSVIEAEILKNFDILYDFMEKDDLPSKAAFEFLESLPPHGKALTITYGFSDASVDDIAASAFPPGNPYKARYSVLTLDADFQHHLKLVKWRQDLHASLSEELEIDDIQGPIDDQLIRHSVQLLNAAICDETIIDRSLATDHDYRLASRAIECFANLLRERVGNEISSSYFTNETRLVDRLMAFLRASLSLSKATKLVGDCYTATIEACLHSRGVWEAFKSRKDLEELHLDLLLRNREDVRIEIAQCIDSNCAQLPESSRVDVDDIVVFYWHILWRSLPQAVTFPKQSKSLFELSAVIFRRYDALHRDEATLRDYISSWSDLVLEYKHEVAVGRNNLDFVVLGFAHLLRNAVQSLKSFKKQLSLGDLAAKFFGVFLFPTAPKWPIAKLEKEEVLPVLDIRTREELYTLIIALCDEESVFKQIIGLTDCVLKNCNVESGEGYPLDSPRDLRSETGYAGLENPQALCYMNSLMTQLFMDLNFRMFIFQAEGSDDDGLLKAMQELFANMQSSYSRSVDMRPFAQYIRGTDKKPINVAIQMDTEEFFRLLMDQLESQLEKPQDKERLKDFYGGVSVNQIKSKDCEHVSETAETLFNIPLEVKGKETLEDSLKAYVEGESLEGENKYKCESCGGKLVNAVKRTCLKTVPDNLIMHLKRFDFDPYTLTRAKINDYFQFPQRINMSPYKVEYLSDPNKPIEEDYFELVGILVHAGGAEQGHYWSYVRVRPDNEDAPRWIKFNDDTVTEQDLSKVDSECFGGNGRHTSAYMLLYQRAALLDKTPGNVPRAPQSLNPIAQLPKELEQQIAEANERHIREHCLFDRSHSFFMQRMIQQMRTLNKGICSEDHGLEKEVVDMAMSHFYQVTARGQDYQEVERILNELKKVTSSCAICTKLVLDWICQHETALADWLIFSYLPDSINHVGHVVRLFIIEELSVLRIRDPIKYGSDPQELELELAMEPAKDGVLYSMLRKLRSLSDHLHYIPRGLDLKQHPWDEYFGLLTVIANAGAFEAASLLDHGFLVMCLELCSAEDDPEAAESFPGLSPMLGRKWGPCYNELIQFLSRMLIKMDLEAEPCADFNERLRTYSDSEKQLFPLSPEEHSLLFRWHKSNHYLIVLNKCLEGWDMSRTNYFPADLLKHMIDSDLDSICLTHIFRTIESGLDIMSPELGPTCLLAAAWFCAYTSDPRFAQAMVTTVNKAFQQGVGAYALDFLKFYNNLTTFVNDKLPDEFHDFFYCSALEFAPHWAVTLLSIEDPEVQQATLVYVRNMLTQQEPGGPYRDERFASLKILNCRVTAVRRIAKAASERMVIIHEKGDVAKSLIEPLYSLIFESSKFLTTVLATRDLEDDDADEIENAVRQCRLTDEYFRTWPESDYDSTFSAEEEIEYADDVVGI